MSLESKSLLEQENPLVEMDGLSNDNEGDLFGNSLTGTAYNCTCPCCGEVMRCEGKTPCYERICPKCGTTMIRNWYDNQYA